MGLDFWVFLGLVMVLIVEVVLVVEEEDAGEGELSVVDDAEQVEPVFVEVSFLLLATVAYMSPHLHSCRKA